MKLEQGQVWKLEDRYFWITKWGRLSIEYKEIDDLESREAPITQVSKKEFCRLIKQAELVEEGGGR